MKRLLLGLWLVCPAAFADQWHIINSGHTNVLLFAGASSFAYVAPGVSYYLDDGNLLAPLGDGSNALDGASLTSLQFADETSGIGVVDAGVTVGNGRVHWVTILDLVDPSSGGQIIGVSIYEQMTFTEGFMAGFVFVLAIGLWSVGKRVVERIFAPTGGT